jgi:hypothetical protein
MTLAQILILARRHQVEASTVTIADESTDTTCFPLFATAAAGNLDLNSGTNLNFNSATGELASTILSGAVGTVTIDDTSLVVVDETNLQSWIDGVDGALYKARGTGVTTSYVSTAAAGGTTFDQPAVSGEISGDQGYFAVSYAGATGVTVADLSSSSTYVYIDNAGALQQQTTVPNRQDKTRKIFTMRIGVDNVAETIINFEYYNNPIGHYTNSMRDLYEYLLIQGVPFKKDQLITGRSDLGFDVSAGSLLEFGGTGDIFNPNIKSFDAVANTAYNLMSRTALVSSETNLQKFWDNAGTITALGSTTLVGHRLYRFSSGNFAMQYGQGNYANMTLAKAGILTEEYVINPDLKNATFFGWWIIESTATVTSGTTLTDFVEYTLGTQGGSSNSLSGAVIRSNNGNDFTDIAATRANLGINAALDKRYSPVFATKDAMSSASPVAIDGLAVTFTAGMRIKTNDFSAGNGGGAEYIVEAGDTSDGFGKILLAGTFTAVVQNTNGKVDLLQVGFVGDGSADDSSALSALISSGKSFKADPTMVFSVSGSYVFGPNITMELSGASFKLRGSLSAGVTMFSIGADCQIDRFSISIPTGITLDKAITFTGDNTTCGEVVCVSVDVQNNTGNENAAIRVIGDNVTIPIQYTENFDNGGLWRGSDFKSEVAEFKSHVRGLWIDTAPDCKFGLIKSHVRSPNASGSPGHNGVLISSASRLTGTRITSMNSGEHGVRFGGDPGCDAVDIGGIYTRLAGGTGVKFRCSSNSVHSYITIGRIVSIDSGDTVNPISNQEGLLLERLQNSYIGYVEIRKEDNAKSCHQGVSFYHISNVVIGKYSIANTNNDCFNFETSGTDDNSNAEDRDITGLLIGGGIASDIDRHAILINFGGGDIRRLQFANGCAFNSIGGDVINAQGSGSGIFAGECLFDLFFVTVTGTPVNGSKLNSDVNVNLTGPHNATTAVAKGSRWHDTSTNNYLVKNGSGTWTTLNP